MRARYFFFFCCCCCISYSFSAQCCAHIYVCCLLLSFTQLRVYSVCMWYVFFSSLTSYLLIIRNKCINYSICSFQFHCLAIARFPKRLWFCDIRLYTMAIALCRSLNYSFICLVFLMCVYLVSMCVAGGIGLFRSYSFFFTLSPFFLHFSPEDVAYEFLLLSYFSSYASPFIDI